MRTKEPCIARKQALPWVEGWKANQLLIQTSERFCTWCTRTRGRMCPHYYNRGRAVAAMRTVAAITEATCSCYATPECHHYSVVSIRGRVSLCRRSRLSASQYAVRISATDCRRRRTDDRPAAWAITWSRLVPFLALLPRMPARCVVKAKFHYTGPTGPDRTRADPHGLFRETRAADPGLRQSPRTLSGRVRSGPCSGI